MARKDVNMFNFCLTRLGILRRKFSVVRFLTCSIQGLRLSRQEICARKKHPCENLYSRLNFVKHFCRVFFLYILRYLPFVGDFWM